MPAKLTLQACKKYANEHNGQCLSENYSGSLSPMLWKCHNSQHSSWLAPFANLKYQNSWCPDCAGVKKHTLQDCFDLAKTKNGSCLSKEYINSALPMEWRCHVNEHSSWLTNFGSIKNSDNWCPECAGNKKYTIYDCHKVALKKNGKCLSEKYINGNSQMLWKCAYEYHPPWLSTFVNINSQNSWCPRCGDMNHAKYTWQAVLDACNTIGITLTNIPNDKNAKIYAVENKNMEWKFLCKCNKIYYPALHNIIGLKHNSCGCVKSQAQCDVYNFILQFNHNAIFNDRLMIPPYELDVYIPELKLAIEYCGLHWHGELFNGQAAKTKHLNKLNLCQEKGIRLITILEDEWLLKEAQTKGYLKAILGKTENKIHARKCEIKEVDINIAREFHTTNHIQGFSGGANFGLHFNGELISLATFAKCNASRNTINYTDIVELMRYTVKINYSVRGGLGKLLSHFKKQHPHIKEIISYSDNRWSSGNIYKTLKFNQINTGNPSYHYFKVGELARHHRYNFTKHRALELFGGNKDIDTEWSIMSRNGYDRIWDCGSSKWVLRINH